MRILATVIVLLWCVGILAFEAVSQAAAALALLVVLVSLRWKRPPSHIIPVFRAALAFALWQAASPVFARLSGVSDSWPRSGRWTQALDTLAAPVLATLTAVGLVWWLVGGVLAIGWIASSATGIYQHFERWEHGLLPWSKAPEWRLYQNFGTEESPRYGATGFLFHRLRFAHAAVALLGPAVAATLSSASEWSRFEAQANPSHTTRRQRLLWLLRVVAAFMTAALFVAVWTSFARAALLTAVVACTLAVMVLMSWKKRRAWVIAGAVVIGAAAALLTILRDPSNPWTIRLAAGVQNLTSGDRAVAMATGLRLALSHPFLGVGFGNHQPAALSIQELTGVTELLAHDSHNLWLTVWAETGLIGVLLGLRFHWVLGRTLYRRWQEGAWLAGGALVSLASFHVLGLVHYLPFHSSVALTFAFVWGLGLSAPLWGEARERQPEPQVKEASESASALSVSLPPG